jgi:hypothetical protein
MTLTTKENSMVATLASGLKEEKITRRKRCPTVGNPKRVSAAFITEEN